MNRQLQRWRQIDDSIDNTDLPDTGRWAAIEAWCSGRGVKPPDKLALAQEVLDGRSVTSETPIEVHDPALTDALNGLLTKITEALQAK